MSVPIRQIVDVALYMMKQRLSGNKHYPLVLMLEPLFRCNLACPGCGKVDYPPEILNQRLSVEDCLSAAEECDAPIVSIPGGEPLIHREMPQIVAGLIKQKRHVYLCTNALLLDKKMNDYPVSPYFTFQIHLDGLRGDHDKAVNKEGVYEIAERAIKNALAKGYNVNINTTLFKSAVPERTAAFLDYMMDLGISSVTISPGYAYERAKGQDEFLNRTNTKNLFRELFKLGKESVKQGKPKWRFSQSALFLDYLAGNQTYECTPWGTPCYSIFGWQRPCYLVGEGYAQSYKELMEETEWEKYGTGRYEKCNDCMVHCGYEPTAANDAIQHPIKAMMASLRGPITEGPMAPELDMSNVRPAEDHFSDHVEKTMQAIKEGKTNFISSENDEDQDDEPATSCCCNCSCGGKC